MRIDPGWLQPLADRTADNWTNVLTPTIPAINPDTLEVKTLNETQVSLRECCITTALHRSILSTPMIA